MSTTVAAASAPTAGPSRPLSSQSQRHHPYAPPASSANRSKSIAIAPHLTAPSPRDKSAGFPPSPPRSMRGQSETPSLGLGIAFGGSAGGKWWDEELPPPPASLASILDSFRRSGETDRELLLSILSAKKAEEERLTALIQTRLTILQARLSLHSATAALGPTTPVPPSMPSSLPAKITGHAYHMTSPTTSNPEMKSEGGLPTLVEEGQEDETPTMSCGPGRNVEAGSPVDPLTPEQGQTHITTTTRLASLNEYPMFQASQHQMPGHGIPKIEPGTQSYPGQSPLPISFHLPPPFSPHSAAEGKHHLPPLCADRTRSRLDTTPRVMVAGPTSSALPAIDLVPPKGRPANGLDMLLDAGMGMEGHGRTGL